MRAQPKQNERAMRAPLEQAALSLGLREVREGQGAPLHAALHPSV